MQLVILQWYVYQSLSLVKCELSMPLRAWIVFNQMPICERHQCTEHSDVCRSTFTQHRGREHSVFYNGSTTPMELVVFQTATMRQSRRVQTAAEDRDHGDLWHSVKMAVYLLNSIKTVQTAYCQFSRLIGCLEALQYVTRCYNLPILSIIKL